MKQGEENTEFVKEPEKETQKFVFQKNKKTIIGAIIIVTFLILITIGIIFSGAVFS